MTILRKGDIVQFVGTVRYDFHSDGKAFVTYGEGDADYCVVPAEKLTMVRALIEVGDRISPEGATGYIDVKMIHGDMLAGINESGRLVTAPINSHNWERIPPVDEIAEQIESGEAASPWRVQQEADGMWSVYEGGAYRTGSYLNEATAIVHRDRMKADAREARGLEPYHVQTFEPDKELAEEFAAATSHMREPQP
jgi:hypothetical protein